MQDLVMLMVRDLELEYDAETLTRPYLNDAEEIRDVLQLPNLTLEPTSDTQHEWVADAQPLISFVLKNEPWFEQDDSGSHFWGFCTFDHYRACIMGPPRYAEMLPQWAVRQIIDAHIGYWLEKGRSMDDTWLRDILLEYMAFVEDRHVLGSYVAAKHPAVSEAARRALVKRKPEA